MGTVTDIARTTKQPRGGYLNIKSFEAVEFHDKKDLDPTENITLAGSVGVVVDYLTRYVLTKDKQDVFVNCFMGASNCRETDEYFDLLDEINGNNTRSIKAAFKIAMYDSVYRSGKNAYKPIEEINPDKATVNNVKILIDRSVKFFKSQKSELVIDYRFKNKGCTDKVFRGDIDYITDDTIWDMKVKRSEPKKEDTLQILIYWIMGLHSGDPLFNKINKIGIFNPRFNIAYTLEVNKILEEIIKEVETDVIGY